MFILTRITVINVLDSILGIYRSIKLLSYKYMFGGIKEKQGSLSATEAFSADIIQRQKKKMKSLITHICRL